jgi:hypothetical protein
MKRTIILGVLLLIVPATTRAETPLLPEDQWTDEAVVWLARAMVSEADWSPIDHAAIAWTLKRQWESRYEKDPRWTFVDQVRAYCAGLRGEEIRTKRSEWVRTLTLDGAEPEGWPDDVLWSNYAPLWRRTIDFARAWGAGRVRDPCEGRAWHWGGTMDTPGRNMRPVDCGMTLNIFYTFHAMP